MERVLAVLLEVVVGLGRRRLLERAHARAAVRARAGARQRGERDRRALLRRVGLEHGEVGDAGRLARPCPCTARPASCCRGTARSCRPSRASSPHAVVIAFSASSSVSFESAAFTTTWRHASPPLALMYFAQAFTPSTEPWNRPGRSGEPVSATTRDRDRRRGHADLGRRQLRRLAEVGRGRVRRCRVVGDDGDVDLLAAAARGRDQHHDEQDADPAEAPQEFPLVAGGPPI